MRLCSRGVVYQTDARGTRAIAIGCGRRECSECGPKRVAVLKRRIASGAPDRMVTLTLPTGSYATPQAAVDALHKAWMLFVKRQRTEFGRLACEYALVVELTEARTPHLHIAVAGKWIDQHALSAFMHAHGCGSIVDVRAIKNARGAARYLSKYFTKSKDFIDQRRNVSFSAYFDTAFKIERVEHKQAAGWWHYTFEPLCTLADSFQSLGHVVEWVSDDEIRVTNSTAPPHRRPRPTAQALNQLERLA